MASLLRDLPQHGRHPFVQPASCTGNGHHRDLQLPAFGNRCGNPCRSTAVRGPSPATAQCRRTSCVRANVSLATSMKDREQFWYLQRSLWSARNQAAGNPPDVLALVTAHFELERSWHSQL